MDSSNSDIKPLKGSMEQMLNEAIQRAYEGITGINPGFNCIWFEPQDRNKQSLSLLVAVNMRLADPRVITAVRYLEETLKETEFKEPEAINPELN